MRWGYLIFAALGAGALMTGLGPGGDIFFAAYSVIMFGIFVDRCLERHQP